MTARLTYFIAALTVLGACQAGDPPVHATQAGDTTMRAAAEDPHAGHNMDSAAVDEHAGHDMSSPTADPHAGHSMPAAGATAMHRDHSPAQGARAGGHEGHGAGHSPRSTAAPAMMRGDSGHAKLMALVRDLLSDSAVARHVREDSVLRRLWGDSAVRNHLLGINHSH